jgi:hypothetical protein
MLYMTVSTADQSVSLELGRMYVCVVSNYRTPPGSDGRVSVCLASRSESGAEPGSAKYSSARKSRFLDNFPSLREHPVTRFILRNTSDWRT